MNVLLPLALTAMLFAPPSGRPPIGPLERNEPRLHDVTFDVTLDTTIPIAAVVPNTPQPVYYEREIMELADTPIVMPVIFQGAYSKVDPDSVRGEIWYENHPDPTLPERFRIDAGLPNHTHLAILPIVQFRGQVLRWRVTFRAQSYSSRIDESGAQQIAWPREWPAEVADALQKQLFIESDDPIFTQAVERVSAGKLRFVPPYLAAKDLIRYCILEIQHSGDGTRREEHGVIRGMEVAGAKATAQSGRGGPHDLVCLSVAMLRAAGIPARPVIGVVEDEQDREQLVSWGEFYLPDAGWVPFDPDEMRGSGLQNRDVRQPWSGFGTIDDLNKRVPLSYYFIPPRSVESPGFPAVWGWDPRPQSPRTVQQSIGLGLINRGRGEDDPQ